MPRIRLDDATIAGAGEDIRLRLPVDGRARSFLLDPRTAILLGNALAEAGLDRLETPEELPQIAQVSINPDARHGGTIARFVTTQGRALSMFVPRKLLYALAEAATAALAYGEPGGRA